MRRRAKALYDLYQVGGWVRGWAQACALSLRARAHATLLRLHPLTLCQVAHAYHFPVHDYTVCLVRWLFLGGVESWETVRDRAAGACAPRGLWAATAAPAPEG